MLAIPYSRTGPAFRDFRDALKGVPYALKGVPFALKGIPFALKGIPCAHASSETLRREDADFVTVARGRPDRSHS